MRITKRTNIAVRLLMFCATHRGRLVTKAEIAEVCNISENHLAQVVNQLSQLGYLTTQRGRNGGMALNRNPADVRIGDVFRDVEGESSIVECLDEVDYSCALVNAGRLREALGSAARAFSAVLDEITLQSLIADPSQYDTLLKPVSVSTQPEPSVVPL